MFQIIQACSTLESNSCNIDGLVHPYEEIWIFSTRQDQSHCSTGVLGLSRLDPTPLTRRRLNRLDQKNALSGQGPSKF